MIDDDEFFLKNHLINENQNGNAKKMKNEE